MTSTDIAARRPSRFAILWVDGFLWAIRVFALVFIVWGVLGSIILSGQEGGLSGDAWRDLTISGLAQGSMYGLIALGYSMVYGVLGFINFAHGEVFMSGALVAYFAADALFEAGVWESNPVIAIGFTLLIAALTSMVIAVAIERVAYRQLRNAPRLIPLITSIGMSFFLQYAIRGLFGSGFQSYPQTPESLQGEAILGFEKVQAIVIVIAAISMFALYQFVGRTKTGRAMRAVAEDKEIAGLMGINVDRVIVTTFAVGGFMAGVAGMLWGLLFRQVYFLTGFLPGIKAFTAAVLGGIGNMAGAMLGGVSLGLFESLGPQVVLGGLRWGLALPILAAVVAAGIGTIALIKRSLASNAVWRLALGTAVVVLAAILIVPAWRDLELAIDIPSLSQLKDVVAFTALVLVLVFRPTGLLGERLAVEERA